MYESDAYTESVVKTVTVSEMIKWKSVYCCSVFSDPTVPPPWNPLLLNSHTYTDTSHTYTDIPWHWHRHTTHCHRHTTPFVSQQVFVFIKEAPVHQAPVVQELYSANHCMPLHVNHYPGVNPLIYVPRETNINFLLTIHNEKKRLGELIK